jgi:hypothetical protein
MSIGNKSDALSSMIIEGFICPECQQDMTSVELLQAHFQLMHLNQNKANTSQPSSSRNTAPNNEPADPSSALISIKFMKQYFNQNQSDGYFNSHTSEFKKLRDNTIGRYVVQTNKLLITLDKLISIDLELFNDDAKRECK